MKNSLALFGLVVSVFWLSACAATSDSDIEVGAGPTAQWKLVWADEFSGSAVDTSKWNYDIDCWGGGNNEQQCYTDNPKNAFIENGILKLTAHKERAEGAAYPPHMRDTKKRREAKNSKDYTSARLTTKNKGDWKYARIDVRAKLPKGQGTWPAIWMLPTDNVYGTWASSGEIDIMEAVNLGARCKSCEGRVENEILGTLHYGAKWPNNTHKSKTTTLDTAADQFHTYTTEWSEGQITWAIDGVPYAAQTSKTWFTKPAVKDKPHAPFDERFHLILNLAIGGKWPEGDNVGGIDPTGFPKALEIDWVRVYECTDDKETAIACAAR